VTKLQNPRAGVENLDGGLDRRKTAPPQQAGVENGVETGKQHWSIILYELVEKGTDRSVHWSGAVYNRRVADGDRVVSPLFNKFIEASRWGVKKM